MRKEELRKLRTLRATPAIIKKAKTDLPYEEEYQYWWSSEKHTRTIEAEYAYYLRCQCLGGYIKVAVFFAPLIRDGSTYPSMEIFINTDGNEWITRYWDDEGNERWNESMIDNLNLPILIPTSDKKHRTLSSFVYACKKKAWINPEGLKTIKRQLGELEYPYRGHGVTDYIMDWQERAKEQKRLEAQKRECDRWDKELSIIPDTPAGLRNWVIRKVLPVFIFYKTGDKEGYCSACGQNVRIPDRPKHNGKIKCPHCRRDAQLKNTNIMSKRLYIEARLCQVVQQVGDTLILRGFRCAGSFRDKNIKAPEITISEYGRKIYASNQVSNFIYGDYKHRTTRWIPGNHVWFSGQIYPRTHINIKCSGLPYLLRSHTGISIDEYIDAEAKYPVVESMVKIGLYKLTEGLVEHSYNYKSGMLLGERSVIKALQIDGARLKRLKAMDGGKAALTWLQYEKNADTRFPDQLIKDYDEADIYPRDLVNIQVIYKGWQHSVVSIYNYIKKQMTICQETLSQTLRTYSDYLSMAEQNKCRMDLEQIIKPKDLKAAHDHQIRISRQEEISKQAKQINKKYKKLLTNIKELSKYEYSDGTYQIVAPKNTEDIIVEGLTLEHCIHRCDFYFERICSKESFILFLRKATQPDSPWYTLEVEPGGNIRQKRTTGDKQNKDLEKALPFLKKWQKKIVESMDTQEKKLAAISDRKRKANYADIRKQKKKVWHGIHQGELLADILEADFVAAI